MPSYPEVIILLACYNGARFISQQIESVLQQDYARWKLYIRDDGSTDGTPDIIADYAQKYSQIYIIPHKNGHTRGPVSNFGRLLLEAKKKGADYILCCDQDDVWRSDKISRQMVLMLEMEKERGVETPLLVHSDLVVADANLSTISPSFMHSQKMRHEEQNPMLVLLVQNFVTGCTCLLNKALLRVALPIPENVMMHDWWLALCAAAFGEMGYVNDGLVAYRQHAENCIGMMRYGAYINPLKNLWRQKLISSNRNFLQSIIQARLLRHRLDAFPYMCRPEIVTLVNQYADLGSIPSKMGRIQKVRAAGIRSQVWFRQLLLYYRILFSLN